ncbi:SET and MYND domain-containing protein 4-like [Macrobrachium rosenbergii]|uniref:SET and MYND domain-containing protein 4-like n=1 Tax=Macrobrachium rosenbergii TaxID=79674 RepID=UPI0034D6663D
MAEANPEEAVTRTVSKSLRDLSACFICRLREDESKFAEVRKRFTGGKTLHELFASIWDLKEAHEMLTPVLEKKEKSAALATEEGREGNKFYQEKNYAKALEKFNVSIMTAPHPTITRPEISTTGEGDNLGESPPINPEWYTGNDAEGADGALAIAYGNRSALMMKLELYEFCLKDIELALRHSYPEDIKHKLLDRKERCLAAKRKQELERQASASLPRNSADSVRKRGSGSSGEMAADFLKRMVDNLTLTAAEVDPLGINGQLSFRKTPVINKKNSSYPCFSDSVKVSYHSPKGRYTLAVKDISPGEVVAVERAFCAGFIEENSTLLCGHCLRFTLNPVPCPGCTMVIFCNDDCRIKGLSEDHWLECKLLPSMISLDFGPMCPAYKMLRNFTLKDIKDFRKKLKKEKPEDPVNLGCDNKGMYNSQSYRAVYGLMGDEETLDDQRILISCQVAFVITKLLHMSGRFFVNSKREPFTPTREDFIAAGSVILSHTFKCHFNLIGVADSRMEKDVGAGIFPTLALINHSCDANLKFYTIGRNVVVRAIRPIKAGEELTVAYGICFENSNLTERRRALEKYQFNCSCEACVNDWPIYDRQDRMKLRETRLTPRVRRGISEAVLKASAMALQIRRLAESDYELNEQDYKAMCKASTLVHRELTRDCQYANDVRHALLLCFIKVSTLE